MSGVLSHSLDVADASPNTFTFASVDTNENNLGTTDSISGRVPTNFSGLSNATLNYLNGKGWNSLDSKLATKYIRESNRISQRLIGYCSAKMYEEARPIARKLNAYVNNSIDDIAIFNDIDRTISALYLARDKAVAFCDKKLLVDVQKANEKKQADEISKLEEDRLKREEAFEMLSSF